MTGGSRDKAGRVLDLYQRPPAPAPAGSPSRSASSPLSTAPAPPAPKHPPPTSLDAAIAAYAESQIGVPCQYAGGTDTGPSAGDDSDGSGQPGWDAPALVMYAVYQATGGRVSLPRNADTQYQAPSIKLVPYSQLRVGEARSSAGLRSLWVAESGRHHQGYLRLVG